MVNSDHTISRYDRYATYPNGKSKMKSTMKEQCFRKKDSNPPVCGVHNVPLVQKRLPDEMIAAGYRAFMFLVCPVSGEVLDEE
jgi:hypothetical protein